MYIMPKSRISNVANMYFNASRENKILAKISEFTVFKLFYTLAATCRVAFRPFDILLQNPANGVPSNQLLPIVSI